MKLASANGGGRGDDAVDIAPAVLSIGTKATTTRGTALVYEVACGDGVTMSSWRCG